MTQRFYFDTSVFGGMFDAEFEEESTLLLKKLNQADHLRLFRFNRK